MCRTSLRRDSQGTSLVTVVPGRCDAPSPAPIPGRPLDSARWTFHAIVSSRSPGRQDRLHTTHPNPHGSVSGQPGKDVTRRAPCRSPSPGPGQPRIALGVAPTPFHASDVWRTSRPGASAVGTSPRITPRHASCFLRDPRKDECPGSFGRLISPMAGGHCRGPGSCPRRMLLERPRVQHAGGSRCRCVITAGRPLRAGTGIKHESPQQRSSGRTRSYFVGACRPVVHLDCQLGFVEPQVRPLHVRGSAAAPPVRSYRADRDAGFAAARGRPR